MAWDNQGATPTKITWPNPQIVPEAQRQNGGWYANPDSGFVERWWNQTPDPAPGSSSAAATPTPSASSFLSANKPQAPDLQGLYDKAITNNPDYIANQKQISDLQASITGKQKAADEAIALINDNPFYSEATRVGKIAKVNEKLNADKSTLTEQLNSFQGKLAQAQSEAQIKLNLAQGQYSINRQEYQDTITQFNNLLSAGAFTNASVQDLASAATATGIPMSMIQSIIDKQKAEAIKPQIITSKDDNDNTVYAIVDQNTGKTISSGKVGTQTTAGGAGSGTNATKNVKATFMNAANNLAETNINGVQVGVFPQLVAQFAPYMTLEEIYSNYLLTPWGKQWGTPKEDAAEISAIYNRARTGKKPTDQEPF